MSRRQHQQQPEQQPEHRPQPPAQRRAIVLGPQRHLPMVQQAVRSLCGPDPRAPVAFVSAGWEEREPEDGEFREHLGQPILNLEVWGRVERIFERDPELLEAMRQRHDRLRRLQEIYRLRLEGLVAAAAELLRRDGEAAVLDPDRDSAIGMVRSLDDEHQQRVAALHAEFDARWRPQQREAVAQHREELSHLLDGAACLCIAGGHVGVLLHRLQLFDLPALWGDRPIVAWSAGAMVLCQRVVLFHRDHGIADTEVMERGFGVLQGIVPLPHARRRLDLRNQCALALMARRFAPDRCVLLDDGSRIDWDGGDWRAHGVTRLLPMDGRLRPAHPRDRGEGPP